VTAGKDGGVGVEVDVAAADDHPDPAGAELVGSASSAARPRVPVGSTTSLR